MPCAPRSARLQARKSGQVPRHRDEVRVTSERKLRIYGGRDPRDVPAYGLMEAARYLGIPVSTLRSWTLGQPYQVRGMDRFFRPVIEIADMERRLLSFLNLFEAYICDALRREHHVSLQRVRTAIEIIRKLYPDSQHPLAEHRFATVGVELFIEEYGQLIGVSQNGQLAMRDCLQRYLRRVDRDRFGLVVRLYPFTRSIRPPEAPRVVVIDPRVLYGRPVIAGTPRQDDRLPERRPEAPADPAGRLPLVRGEVRAELVPARAESRPARDPPGGVRQPPVRLHPEPGAPDRGGGRADLPAAPGPDDPALTSYVRGLVCRVSGPLCEDIRVYVS